MIKTTLSRLVLFAALTVPTPVRGELFHQTAAPLVRRDRVGPTGYDEVRSYDLATRTARAIYRSAGRIPDEVDVSPEGTYVSFIEALTPSQGVSRRRLVVIDLRGTVVRAIDDAPVGTYAWCCRPGIVAVINGEHTEEGDIGFKPDSVRLIDITTGVARRLDGIEGLPYQLHWSAVDSALYIKTLPTGGTSRVYRYDVRTGGATLTSHRGVFFSPDGRYYYDWFTPGIGFHLYRSTDDVEVTGELASQVERYTRWMPGTGHTLVVVETPPPDPRPPDARPSGVVIVGLGRRVVPDRWNRAVDAETKRVTERFQGDMRAGWRTNGPVLPVEKRSGVELVAPRQK